MSCANKIKVEGAGLANANGTYIRKNNTEIFYLNGDENSLILFLNSPFPGAESFIPYVWSLSPNPYNGEDYYTFSELNYEGCVEQIDNNKWTVGSLGISPVPSFTAIQEETINSNPESVNNNPEPESSSSKGRSKRLRHLGYY